MLHHTDVIGLQKIAPGGWIFVEFYFVISGFFVTRHFDNEKMNDNIEKEALLYTINKLKNVIPYAYVGIFIGAFNQIINNRDSFSTICEVLLSLPANLLFLGGLGIARYNLNGPLWYLSVMILVMPLLILLLVKVRPFFYYLGSWIIPLFLYLIMFSVRGNIEYFDKQYFIHCLLRAIAGLSAGSCSKYLKSIKMSVGTLRLLTFVELISFAVMLFAAYKTDCLNIAFASVLMAMLTVGISLSGKEYLQNVLPHCIGKIGSFSVPIFCLHRPIFGTVRYFFSDLPDEKRILVGVGLSLIIPFLLKLFVDLLNPNMER